MDDDRKLLGRRLFQQLDRERARQGISKAEAARRLGKDWTTIYRWANVGNDSLSDLNDYAEKVLGCGIAVNLTQVTITLTPRSKPVTLKDAA